MESKQYPRDVGQYLNEIDEESRKGRGNKKQGLVCKKCKNVFYVPTETTKKGRPRSFCSSCRIAKRRAFRKPYDRQRKESKIGKLKDEMTCKKCSSVFYVPKTKNSKGRPRRLCMACRQKK